MSKESRNLYYQVQRLRKRNIIIEKELKIERRKTRILTHNIHLLCVVSSISVITIIVKLFYC